MTAPIKDAMASIRGRIGGFRLAATHDTRVTSAPGRAAFLAKFELQVDPTRELSPGERERRAKAAKAAYFAALAYRSAQVRRARSQRITAATEETV